VEKQDEGRRAALLSQFATLTDFPRGYIVSIGHRKRTEMKGLLTKENENGHRNDAQKLPSIRIQYWQLQKHAAWAPAVGVLISPRNVS
jgi:hypothetical protein